MTIPATTVVGLSHTIDSAFLWDGVHLYTQRANINTDFWPLFKNLKKSPDEYAPSYLVTRFPPFTLDGPVEIWKGALDKHLPRDLLTLEPLPHPKGR